MIGIRPLVKGFGLTVRIELLPEAVELALLRREISPAGRVVSPDLPRSASRRIRRYRSRRRKALGSQLGPVMCSVERIELPFTSPPSTDAWASVSSLFIDLCLGVRYGLGSREDGAPGYRTRTAGRKPRRGPHEAPLHEPARASEIDGLSHWSQGSCYFCL